MRMIAPSYSMIPANPSTGRNAPVHIFVHNTTPLCVHLVKAESDRVIQKILRLYNSSKFCKVQARQNFCSKLLYLVLFTSGNLLKIAHVGCALAYIYLYFLSLNVPGYLLLCHVWWVFYIFYISGLKSCTVFCQASQQTSGISSLSTPRQVVLLFFAISH